MRSRYGSHADPEPVKVDGYVSLNGERQAPVSLYIDPDTYRVTFELPCELRPENGRIPRKPPERETVFSW